GAPRHTTDAVLAVRGLGRGGVARLAAARRRGLRRSPVPRRRVLRARGPRDARERAVVEPRGRGPRAARDGAARGSCPTRLAARRRRHAARGTGVAGVGVAAGLPRQLDRRGRGARAAAARVVAGAPADPRGRPERHGARAGARRPARLRALHVPCGDRDRAPARRGDCQRGARTWRAGARSPLGRCAGVPAVPGRRGGAGTAAAVAAMTFPFPLPSWLLVWTAFLPPLAALGAATLVRRAHARAGENQPWLEAGVVGLTLVPLAVVVAWPGLLLPARAALAAGLSIALLAHDPRDLPQTEVALKIMWVLTAAFALSWAGDALLAMASGSARAREQWPALALALDPYALWTAALSLSLM